MRFLIRSWDLRLKTTIDENNWFQHIQSQLIFWILCDLNIYFLTPTSKFKVQMFFFFWIALKEVHNFVGEFKNKNKKSTFGYPFGLGWAFKFHSDCFSSIFWHDSVLFFFQTSKIIQKNQKSKLSRILITIYKLSTIIYINIKL